MDYQYIKTIYGGTYVEASGSSPFPRESMEELFEHIGGNYLPEENIPGIVSFFCMNQRGKTPIVVLSCLRKKKNTESIGYFSQSMGWSWDKQLLTEKLDSVLKTGFLSEEEIDSYISKSMEVPLGKEGSGTIAAVPADRRSLEAVCYAIMHKWGWGDGIIRIAVPSGCDYNEYVLSAVKQIYSMLPVGLRMRAGFCSYLPKGRGGNMENIYFGFIPEEQADGNTFFLDGSRNGCVNSALQIRSGLGDVDRFMKNCFSFDAEMLSKLLDDVYRYVEGDGDADVMQRLMPTSYSLVGNGLESLRNEGSDRQQLNDWLSFYGRQQEYIPFIRENLKLKIRSELRSETLAAAAADACLKAEASATSDSLVAYDKICAEKEDWSEAVWKAVVKALREKLQGNEKVLCDFLWKNTEKLSNIITAQRVTDLDLERAEKAVAKLPSEKNLQNEDEIKAALDSAQNIYNYSEKLFVKSSNTLSFLAKLNEYIEILKFKIGEAGAKFEKISNELQSAGNYFEALKIYSENRIYIDEMQEKPKAELLNIADAKKPSGGKEYIALFNEIYGNISLSRLAVLDEFSCKKILSDLSGLGSITAKLNTGDRLNKMQEDYYSAKTKAALVSPICENKLQINGVELDDNRFEMLTLRFVPENGEEKRIYNKNILQFAKLGVYSAQELPTVCNIFINNGFNIQELLDSIFKAHFTDCRERDYKAAFTMLLDSKKLDKNALSEKCNSFGDNKIAVSAARSIIDKEKNLKQKLIKEIGAELEEEIREELEEKNKAQGGDRLKAPLIAAGSAAGVFLVTTAVFLSLFLNKNGKLKSIENQNTNLQKQVEALVKEKDELTNSKPKADIKLNEESVKADNAEDKSPQDEENAADSDVSTTDNAQENNTDIQTEDKETENTETIIEDDLSFRGESFYLEFT